MFHFLGCGCQAKLAEYIAGRGEILLTSGALAAAYGGAPETDRAACTVSGMELVYCRTLCPPGAMRLSAR